MRSIQYQFSFQEYASASELNTADADLLQRARQLTEQAYAPYSNFKVGAVALLKNGEIITGSNQENASYPVGICAERTLLAAAGTLHSKMPILTMAISYHNLAGELNDTPISPCGMCRQALSEYEERTGQTIRIILAGIEGPVHIIEKASQLLPLAFSGSVLKK